MSEDKARSDGYLTGRLEAQSTVAKLESELALQKQLVADAMSSLAKERETNLSVEDIVGYSEIASKLNVSLTVVHRWAERRSSTRFPNPIKVMSQCHIYDMRDVQSWYTHWSLTRRERPVSSVSESMGFAHKWPTGDQHLFTEWRANTGTTHPSPTQYRTCIHPKCKEVQTRPTLRG